MFGGRNKLTEDKVYINLCCGTNVIIKENVDMFLHFIRAKESSKNSNRDTHHLFKKKNLVCIEV